MSWLEGLRARLRLLFGRRAAEARMTKEIGFHIQMETERLIREQGLDTVEARRRALVAFGSAARADRVVTFVVQQIDHVGRMRNDGTRAPVGKSVKYGFDVEIDYAFTDRWSISTSLPLVLAKFTDPNAPPLFVPFGAVDACTAVSSESRRAGGGAERVARRSSRWCR
jgi:hypothetical protein